MKISLVLLLLIPLTAQSAIPDVLMHDFSPDALHENTITLDAPDVAENSAVVPLRIRAVRLPDQYARITRIDVYNEHNPGCPISRYRLGDSTDAEGLGFRLNIGITSTLYVLAYLDNGMVLSGEHRVKSVLSCCIGCDEDRYQRMQRQATSGCITRF